MQVRQRLHAPPRNFGKLTTARRQWMALPWDDNDPSNSFLADQQVINTIQNIQCSSLGESALFPAKEQLNWRIPVGPKMQRRRARPWEPRAATSWPSSLGSGAGVQHEWIPATIDKISAELQVLPVETVPICGPISAVSAPIFASKYSSPNIFLDQFSYSSSWTFKICQNSQIV